MLRSSSLHRSPFDALATPQDGLGVAKVQPMSADYDDYQASFLVVFTQSIRNLDAEADGGEIELQATPSDGLDLSWHR